MKELFKQERREIHRTEKRRNFVLPRLSSPNQDTRVDIMNVYCDEPFQFFPTNTDYKELRGTFITNCICNGFLTYTAIMLNIVTICAIRKTSTLPKNLKTLLVSLAISDVGVGLVGQPTYLSLHVSWLKLNDPSCNANRLLTISGNLFSLSSFLGVVAVTVERFLALRLHLRYQELVSQKRVGTLVISIWAFSLFVSLMVFWSSVHIMSIIISVAASFSFIVSVVLYLRIYLTVRRHKRQIQSLQVQDISQSGEITNFLRLVKSAVDIFYVYLVFLFCYSPCFISVVLIKIFGSSVALKRFFLFSVTLVFLNSSLNPLIYCWKMRHIRRAIMDMLRNTNWNTNRSQ